MKIFEKDSKINFVDDNNVFVGFDYSLDCSETFGWSLTRTFPTKCEKDVNSISPDDPERFRFNREYYTNGIDPDGFQFDREYCTPAAFDVEGVELDYRGAVAAVVFRLLKGEDEIFLMLWNTHNGYYHHGFDMTSGDEQLYEGWL
jgi:hypothetical protein